MHSFGYRANALLTLVITILAVMCAVASFSDNFNSPSPSATVEVLNINRFQKLSTGNDEIFLWDSIIPLHERAKFWIRTTSKYRFTDQGNNLRGKGFNMKMHWHVMPKTGKMLADKIVLSGYRLPDEYR